MQPVIEQPPTKKRKESTLDAFVGVTREGDCRVRPEKKLICCQTGKCVHGTAEEHFREEEVVSVSRLAVGEYYLMLVHEKPYNVNSWDMKVLLYDNICSSSRTMHAHSVFFICRHGQ